MRSAELGSSQGKPWLRTWSATMVATVPLAVAVATVAARQIDMITPAPTDGSRNNSRLHFICSLHVIFRGKLRQTNCGFDLGMDPVVDPHIVTGFRQVRCFRRPAFYSDVYSLAPQPTSVIMLCSKIPAGL
jgi:hypothetical protein